MFNINKLSRRQKELRKSIIEMSYERKLSHIGSCFTVLDLIDAVYSVKRPIEKFVLSSGHAGIAFYAVLEKNKLVKKAHLRDINIHPDRSKKLNIDVSTGSLGQGLPIALGMALADKKKNVYCIISDGECAEGSIWESLRISQENKVNNLKILINANGWSAYNELSLTKLFKRLKGFGCNITKIDGHDTKKIIASLKRKTDDGPVVVFAKTEVSQLPFLKGQDAHYCTMKEEDYNAAIKLLKI